MYKPVFESDCYIETTFVDCIPLKAIPEPIDELLQVTIEKEYCLSAMFVDGEYFEADYWDFKSKY